MPLPTMVGGGNPDQPRGYGAERNLNLKGRRPRGIRRVAWGCRCGDGVRGSPGASVLLFLTREEETRADQAEGEEYPALCLPLGMAPTSCQTRGLRGLAWGCFNNCHL